MNTTLPTASRLSPNELLAWGQARLSRRDGHLPMLVVTRLNRSDQLGAMAGDGASGIVLGQMVARITATFAADDRYAVASHDELWILLDHVDDAAGGMRTLARLRDALRPAYEVGSEQGCEPLHVVVDPVIGAAWSDEPTVGIGPFLQAAWSARGLAAQAEGHLWLQRIGVDDAASRQAELHAAVRRKLYGNELEVHFQPQIDLHSGRCVAAEALIRWPREAPMQVSAAQIVAVCEGTGLLGQLTQFVVNHVLRQQLRWHARGLSIVVGINLNAQTIEDGTFARQVAASCESWNVAPSSLQFELTEDSIGRQEHVTLECMRALRALGCETAIDDVGSGCASFAQFRKFPVDELKIDRSFVQAMGRGANERQIVKALIDLAHGFNLRALAEGVEDAETEQVLRELGCDRVQGFLYSRALPPDAFAAWVQEWDRQTLSAAIDRLGVTTAASGASVA